MHKHGGMYLARRGKTVNCLTRGRNRARQSPITESDLQRIRPAKFPASLGFHRFVPFDGPMDAPSTLVNHQFFIERHRQFYRRYRI
jgi:hypothetical protein